MSVNVDELKAFIKSSRNDMVALETLLTSHPALAPENGGSGESEKAAALIEWLTAQGFTKFEQFNAPDTRVKSGERPNIIVTIPGTVPAPAVWIMTHLDVVPVGNEALWNSNPWTVVENDGKIFGRGVEDNQQGLVSSVFAALAYVKKGIQPAHTIKLLFMADEEVGSEYGIKYLLREHSTLFGRNDLYLIPDGGDSLGQTIEIAEKNILWLRVHVAGLQAHGSRPDQGHNACLAADDLALRLHALESVFNKHDSLFTPDYSTFSPTKREANVQTVNIIPGDDVFYMDCRVLPCYTIQEVLAEVQKCCGEVERKYSVKIDVTTPQAEQSPATPADSPVVVKLAAAIKAAHNIAAKTIGIGGGTVAAELRQSGYNAAVWSTLDDCAHQVNEYSKIDNIIADAETMAYLFSE